MSKPILLLDVDGVLCDFATPALDFLRSIGDTRTTTGILSKWDLFDGNEEVEERFRRDVASHDGFCRGMKPLPGAVDFVMAAKREYDVVFLTAPYDVLDWHRQREKWVQDTFDLSRDNVVFARRKELVPGCAFVDDKASNVMAWSRSHPDRLAILWDQPWNRNDDVWSDTLRVGSWERLSQLLASRGLPSIL